MGSESLGSWNGVQVGLTTSTFCSIRSALSGMSRMTAVLRLKSHLVSVADTIFQRKCD